MVNYYDEQENSLTGQQPSSRGSPRAANWRRGAGGTRGHSRGQARGLATRGGAARGRGVARDVAGQSYSVRTRNGLAAASGRGGGRGSGHYPRNRGTGRYAPTGSRKQARKSRSGERQSRSPSGRRRKARWVNGVEDGTATNSARKQKPPPGPRCSYCKAKSPSSALVQCFKTKQWFCNSYGDTQMATHIIHHLRALKSFSVTLSTGTQSIHCTACGKPNIFQLGYDSQQVKTARPKTPRSCSDGEENSADSTQVTETKLSSNSMFVCRDCSLGDSDANWKPLVQDGRIVNLLVPSATDCKMVNFHKINQLEEARRTDPTIQMKHLRSLPLEKQVAPTQNHYETTDQYKSIHRPLLELEKDQTKKIKDAIQAENLAVRWQITEDQKRKVVYFTLPCFDEINGYKIGLGETMKLKYNYPDGLVFECPGYILKIPDNTDNQFGLELYTTAKDTNFPTIQNTGTPVCTGFILTYLWKSTCFDRIGSAIDRMVNDSDSMSRTVCHQILGITSDAESSATFNVLGAPDDLSLPGQPKLNESQESAVRTCLEQPLTLIQGPPGTGKTEVSTNLVNHLVDAWGPGQNVLVTAPSNIAVDELARRISQTGRKVVRIFARSRENVPSTVDDLALHKLLLSSADDQHYRTLDAWISSNMYKEMRIPKATADELYRTYQRMKGERETYWLKDAEVICTTCSGAGDSRLKDFRFKAVIIDEASQATEGEALIPITKGAQQVVLIGDQCQLGPVVLSKKAAKAGLSLSLFERCINMGMRPHTLTLQYRMHPCLSNFPSAQFYNGIVQNGVRADQRYDRLSAFDFWPNDKFPSLFYRTKGREENSASGTSFLNRAEAATVEQLLFQMLSFGIKPQSIGIITPYEGQRSYLIQYLGYKAHQYRSRGIEFQNDGYRCIEISSINAFQGREKEYIILSLVRANRFDKIGFLGDPRRLNVALTRSKLGLIIVGNTQSLDSSPDWRALLAFYSERNALVEGNLQKFVNGNEFSIKPRSLAKVTYVPKQSRAHRPVLRFASTEEEATKESTEDSADSRDVVKKPAWIVDYPDLDKFLENEDNVPDPLFVKLMDFLNGPGSQRLVFFHQVSLFKSSNGRMIIILTINTKRYVIETGSGPQFQLKTMNLAKHILGPDVDDFDLAVQKLITWSPKSYLETLTDCQYKTRWISTTDGDAMYSVELEIEDEPKLVGTGADLVKLENSLALQALRTERFKDPYIRSLERIERNWFSAFGEFDDYKCEKDVKETQEITATVSVGDSEEGDIEEQRVRHAASSMGACTQQSRVSGLDTSSTSMSEAILSQALTDMNITPNLPVLNHHVMAPEAVEALRSSYELEFLLATSPQLLTLLVAFEKLKYRDFFKIKYFFTDASQFSTESRPYSMRPAVITKYGLPSRYVTDVICFVNDRCYHLQNKDEDGRRQEPRLQNWPKKSKLLAEHIVQTFSGNEFKLPREIGGMSYQVAFQTALFNIKNWQRCKLGKALCHYDNTLAPTATELSPLRTEQRFGPALKSKRVKQPMYIKNIFEYRACLPIFFMKFDDKIASSWMRAHQKDIINHEKTIANGWISRLRETQQKLKLGLEPPAFHPLSRNCKEDCYCVKCRGVLVDHTDFPNAGIRESATDSDSSDHTQTETGSLLRSCGDTDSIIKRSVSRNGDHRMSSTPLSPPPSSTGCRGEFKPMTLRTTDIRDPWLAKYPEFAHDFEVHPWFKRLVENLQLNAGQIVFDMSLQMDNNSHVSGAPQRLTILIAVNTKKCQLQSVASGFYEKTRNLAYFLMTGKDDWVEVFDQDRSRPRPALEIIMKQYMSKLQKWQPSTMVRIFLDRYNLAYQVFHRENEPEMCGRLLVEPTITVRLTMGDDDKFEGTAQQLEDAKTIALLNMLNDQQYKPLFVRFLNIIEKKWSRGTQEN